MSALKDVLLYLSRRIVEEQLELNIPLGYSNIEPLLVPETLWKSAYSQMHDDSDRAYDVVVKGMSALDIRIFMLSRRIIVKAKSPLTQSFTTVYRKIGDSWHEDHRNRRVNDVSAPDGNYTTELVELTQLMSEEVKRQEAVSDFLEEYNVDEAFDHEEKVAEEKELHDKAFAFGTTNKGFLYVGKINRENRDEHIRDLLTQLEYAMKYSTIDPDAAIQISFKESK